MPVLTNGFELTAHRQQTLFTDNERVAQGRLDQVVDQIRKRFGRETQGRGIALDRSE